jgi:hypothetical protein
MKHSGFGSGGLGTFRTGADGAEKIVGVDASGVAVGERDLNGVIPYLSGSGGSGFGLEHGKRGRSGKGGRGFGERTLFVALVVAGGAVTIFPEIDEIEMGGVAVGPSDVNAGVVRNVYFYAGGFSAGM